MSFATFLTISRSTATVVPDPFEDEVTIGTLCPVAEDVVAIHNRTHIKFVFLRTGKSRLLVPTEHRGVGVIGGRDDISVLAWSDIGPPAPKIHVYRYGDPQNIIDLEGKIQYFIYTGNLFRLISCDSRANEAIIIPLPNRLLAWS